MADNSFFSTLRNGISKVIGIEPSEEPQEIAPSATDTTVPGSGMLDGPLNRVRQDSGISSNTMDEVFYSDVDYGVDFSKDNKGLEEFRSAGYNINQDGSLDETKMTKSTIKGLQERIGLKSSRADGDWGKNSQLALDMTVARKKKSNESRIFASGRYQAIPRTLAMAVKSGYIRSKDKYGKETQEKLMDYLVEKKRPQIDRYINGSGSQKAALLALAQEWASMPSPVSRSWTSKGKNYSIKIGDSYYGGANASHVTIDKVKQVLLDAKTSGDDTVLRDFIAKHESQSAGNYNAYNQGTRNNRIVAASTDYDFDEFSVADILSMSGDTTNDILYGK